MRGEEEPSVEMLGTLSARIDACAAEIDNRNRRNLVLFSSGALLVSFMVFFVSLFLPAYRRFVLPHAILFLYSAALYWVSHRCQRKKTVHIRLIQYFSLAPLLIGGILTGTYFDPLKPAVTIIIFLCILPLYIIDRPVRIILYQLLFSAAFVICSYLIKPFEVFQSDTLYLPIYLCFGIGTNLFSLVERVESAENFVQARYESEHDSLTRLYNRRSGSEKVIALFQAQVLGTFAIIDIDNFKRFNDEYGHQIGDEVLCEVSKAMHMIFHESDVIMRLGGDEFAIYAPDVLDTQTCQKRFLALSQQLLQSCAAPHGTLEVRISVGCVICSDPHPDFDIVCNLSDAALYRAKNSGKGKIEIVSQPLG